MDRWQNQEEAYQFAMSHPSTMLDMDMGTGKTRVAIDTLMNRQDVHKILIVCPKAVIPVWRINFDKFYPNDENALIWDETKGSIKQKTSSMINFLLDYWDQPDDTSNKYIIVINYDICWRSPLGDALRKINFDMIILDESHRAKSAGSKVSKFLALLGKYTKYKMCLSGTPMANSPLDVYGQYRFLDRTIFGTNFHKFQQQYAILGGPDMQWVVGYKNGVELQQKFDSIAYHCKMSDVSDRLKLPEKLPNVILPVELPARDMKTAKKFGKDFIAECGSGTLVARNALVKLLRLQQICSGFCQVQDSPLDEPRLEELNTSKAVQLQSTLEDISPVASVVVFCVFQHDLDQVASVGIKAQRKVFEVSGRRNELKEWQNTNGGLLVVQIQAGAEGIDMTKAHHAIYFSLPHSLALYEQSRARLHRPGQTQPVSFIHLIATNTVDEAMYESLKQKKDVIESIKDGTLNLKYVR